MPSFNTPDLSLDSVIAGDTVPFNLGNTMGYWYLVNELH